MAEFYSLLCGLPDLRLDDAAAEAVSLSEVRELLGNEDLSGREAEILGLFFLYGDCRNLVVLLKDSAAKLPYIGNYSREELQELIADALEDVFEDDRRFPDFMAPFVREYVERRNEPGYFAEDRIMVRYWGYLMKRGTGFVSKWAELNLNICNILTALICRAQGWDVQDYIYGDNDVTYMILNRQSADFDLSREIDYVPELMQIVQEADPVQKERRIDTLRWLWLENETFQEPFDINAVYAYLLKVQMLERWTMLDPERGREAFTGIIENLRSECKVPDEFIIHNA